MLTRVLNALFTVAVLLIYTLTPAWVIAVAIADAARSLRCLITNADQTTRARHCPLLPHHRR